MRIKKYFQYGWYLIRHKWYVGLECWREGLYWRALTHDLSKFYPSEWFPYMNYFYGKVGDDISKGRDETGYYKPTDTGDKAFDWAWFLHQKRNSHHWQYYVLPEDEGGLKILEMSKKDRLEMVCDWVGAGKAQGNFSKGGDRFSETKKWYAKNKDKMRLHPNTIKWIESKIL